MKRGADTEIHHLGKKMLILAADNCSLRQRTANGWKNKTQDFTH